MANPTTTAPPPPMAPVTYDPAFEVELPSGAPFFAMDQAGYVYLSRVIDAYVETYKFDNISDLQTVDQIVLGEFNVWRWNQEMAGVIDRYGLPVDVIETRRRVNETTTQLRQLRRQLGIDRPARDRAKGEGSIPHYWQLLTERAHLFGIMRNKQACRAVELANQLVALHTANKNCASEKERNLIHVADRDIVAWIGEVFIPSFAEIDEAFRNTPETGQRYWIRTQ